jgi:hypothetical protein
MKLNLIICQRLISKLSELLLLPNVVRSRLHGLAIEKKESILIIQARKKIQS